MSRDITLVPLIHAYSNPRVQVEIARLHRLIHSSCGTKGSSTYCVGNVRPHGFDLWTDPDGIC